MILRGMAMDNMDLVEEIAVGKWTVCQGILLIADMDLHKNESFIRCLMSELNYELNKSRPNADRVNNLRAFADDIEMAIEKEF